ncbi:hypothetical protein BH23ACT10_BH23ACT10_32400 [soil metagenome]
MTRGQPRGLVAMAVVAAVLTAATVVVIDRRAAVLSTAERTKAIDPSRTVGGLDRTSSSGTRLAYGDGFVRGVAVAGGSFGDGTHTGGRVPMTNSDPGTYGTDWFYDVDGQERIDDAGLAYLADRGVGVIRVDFRWERLQPRLRGPLDPAEVRRLTALLDAARANGLGVILDCHNYGHYKTAGSPNVGSPQGGWPIGHARAPVAAFADLWRRVAARWNEHPALWGWELMNEPVDMGRAGRHRWQRASQAAVDAVRSVGGFREQKAILVAGYSWSTVQQWEEVNGDPWIDDPLHDPHRLIYVGHHYWDGDNDSVYGTETPADLSGSVAVHRTKVLAQLRDFTGWLRRHHVRGAITEVGWPAGAGWNRVAEAWFDEADRARLHVVSWATGAAWGDYELLPYEATGGSWHAGDVIDRANTQATVLESHPTRRVNARDPRTSAH